MNQNAERFYRKLSFIWEGIEPAGDETSDAASAFLRALSGDGTDNILPTPFNGAVSILHNEYENAVRTGHKAAFDKLERLLDEGTATQQIVAETLWAVFFPEALHLSDDPDKQIPLLRKKRLIRIAELCPDPVTQASDEIIFTSNILLSPPVSDTPNGDTSEELEQIIAGARKAGMEEQRYWYDHPIPIGTAVKNDEAIYGLSGLADTLKYEKRRGTAAADAKLNVLLSVSVTHSGLHQWALPWLRAQINSSEPDLLTDLDVFAFTEDDASGVVDLLIPWLADDSEVEILRKTFGVDGEYGRHYSFLKALPALWAMLADSDMKGTFKIDLDQVFPQEELAAETGKSAFEHFQTPLWGATGKDSDGREVEMGMIAGALVNEKDIAAGIFTPDIPWPAELPEGEDLLFFKQRTMAVSTRAELMTQYGLSGAPDGVTEALQRIHVTGGTNGIRFDALRKHRPFTPSFIGRAEDQGYILSVLAGSDGEAVLRYVHASGLIMRHDKDAFAASAVTAGKAGSYIGDLVRLFVFSHYAEFLPGGQNAVKNTVDPFTGCFITIIPATLALLRLALHLLSAEGGSTDERKALMDLAGRRLAEWINDGDTKSRELETVWNTERLAWNAYYNALDRIEQALLDGNPDAGVTRDSFNRLLSNCRISVQE